MLLWGCLLLGSIRHPIRKSKSVHMEKPAWKGTGAHGQQSALTSRHRSEPLFKPECLPPRPQTITLSKWLTQRIYKIVNHCFRTLHFGKICYSDILTIAFTRGLVQTDQPPRVQFRFIPQHTSAVITSWPRGSSPIAEVLTSPMPRLLTLRHVNTEPECAYHILSDRASQSRC